MWNDDWDQLFAKLNYKKLNWSTSWTGSSINITIDPIGCGKERFRKWRRAVACEKQKWFRNWHIAIIIISPTSECTINLCQWIDRFESDLVLLSDQIRGCSLQVMMARNQGIKIIDSIPFVGVNKCRCYRFNSTSFSTTVITREHEAKLVWLGWNGSWKFVRKIETKKYFLQLAKWSSNPVTEWR